MLPAENQLSSHWHDLTRESRAAPAYTILHLSHWHPDQSRYLVQAQCTDIGPTSPSAGPTIPSIWQCRQQRTNCQVTGTTWPEKAGQQIPISKLQAGSLSFGARTAQSVVCWASCLACCSLAGSTLQASSTGDSPLELTWVLTSFPKTLLDESINRELVCARMHFIAQTQKILMFMFWTGECRQQKHI